MATRERKPPIIRRQQISSPSLRSTPDQLTKNDSLSTDAQKTVTTKTSSRAAAKTPLARKLAKGQTKKNQKKIALKLNTRAKRKVSQRLAKSLINTARVLETKKLLKNGKLRQRKVKEEIDDDGPPVLEPIFPIGDNLDKKPQKKRIVRNPAARKIKIEPEDLAISSDSSISSIKNTKKAKVTVKTECIDTVTETIEGVVSGTSFIPIVVKQEPDSLSESSRSDTIKPKKLTKKQKLSLLQKEIKKENIENTLTTIGQSDQKVIDMLDLNVLKVRKTYPPQKRRHTIEKYPMGSDISNGEDFPPFNLCPSLPRSSSPRTKRKIRSSLDNKVINPYTIRPPARFLRNGKQRKMKDNLLAGLDNSKKRKRVCSEYSGSEVSKLSGNDSDSSVSDLSSFHGTEVSDLKDIEVKKQQIDNHSQSSALFVPIEVKRSLSIDEQVYTDTNSNVCDDLNAKDNMKMYENDVKNEIILSEDIYPSQSSKVPEKLLILDIMKQNFNETIIDTEKNSPPKTRPLIRVSTDDLLRSEPEEKESEEKKMSEIISKLVETMGTEEFTATINTTDEGTALVMQNGEIKENSTWDNNLSIIEPSPVQISIGNESQENNLSMKEPSPVQISIGNESQDNNLSMIEPSPVQISIGNDSQLLEALPLPNYEGASEPISESLSLIDNNNLSQGVGDIVNELTEILQQEPLPFENKSTFTTTAAVEECPIKISDVISLYTNTEATQIIETSSNEEVEAKEEVEPEEKLEPNEKMEIDEPKSDNAFEKGIELKAGEEFKANEECEVNEEVRVNQEFKAAEILKADELKQDGDVKLGDKMETDAAPEINCLPKAPATLDESELHTDISEPIPSTSADSANHIEESEEQVAIKESILSALGLQSLRAAEEAKLKDKPLAKGETYTGTLKAVIKLNRDGKKKNRNHPLKITLQKNKSKNGEGNSGNQDDYKIMKEGGSSWKHGSQSSDTAGAHRKTHYYNRSNPDNSSEHTSDGEVPNAEGPTKALVIPEKASSFSIHPERLCKDECSYCFGKFGLFDTPCHIAQIKTVDRQDKILSIEKHLTRDSCLCDACYRHIDRKANTPSYISKSFKRGPLIAPGPKENHCHVLGCRNVSTNVLRRKWIIKMKKQICQVINIDLDNPGLHSIPICDEHYIALEHLMICAMCKRRLARNHIHYIGPEVEDLNTALQEEDIPLRLSDKPVVCKLCKCFASVILKNPDERPDNCSDFFVEYKKRLLHFNNIIPMDEAAAEEPIIVPTKDRSDKEPTKKKRKLSKNNSDDNSQSESPTNEDRYNNQNSTNTEQNNGNSRPDSPSDYLVDYNSLIPSIALECEDSDSTKDPAKKNLKRIPNLESIKNSVDITVRNVNSDLAVKRLGSNPSLSVRQLFPGEEDLGLQGRIDFSNVKEKTPEGWEKCKMTLQYDKTTKQLWQDLQKPYGNSSSFLRHLILLEKYFRNGDLELKSNSSQQSINYSESVQNRLKAYDNIPSGVSRPINILELNNPPSNPTQKSHGGSATNSSRDYPVVSQTSVPGLPVMTTPNVSVTTVRPSPVSITQINQPINPLIPVTITKARPPPPPGLISLLPGTNRPVAPLIKTQPQSQKIKFPITKNWRPTLIPIDPSKPPEKKTGLVQVISGGKPFHITLEDYKKMCAIKRSFEIKQKKQQEMQKRVAAQLVTAGSSLLKANKGLVITKGPPVQRLEAVKVDTEPSENILEKLDQQVENLESKFHESNSLLSIPKIPKSLTVIPQTVARKTSRPASPALLITQKPNPNIVHNKS